MNPRDFELLRTLLLPLMEEDYVALWEIEAEVAGTEADLTAERKRERAAYGVQELLRRGWARAYWTADGDDTPTPVPDTQVSPTLADDTQWAPTHFWEPAFRLAATDTGEQTFHQIDTGELDADSLG